MVNRRCDQSRLVVLALADLVATSVCWLLAYYLRWGTDIVPLVNEVVPPVWWCLRTLPLVLIIAFFSYRHAGLYQLGRRLPFWQESTRLLTATGLMLLLVVGSTFYLKNPYQSRLVTVVFWGLAFVGLLLVRRIFGAYYRFQRRQGGLPGRALIVGTGRAARQLDRALRHNNWLGLQPVGFVDDPLESKTADDLKTPLHHTVGKVDDLPRLVDDHDIDHVFIALPLSRYGEVKKIFRGLSNSLVEIRLVPDVPSLANVQVQMGELEGLPVLNLRGAPHGLGDVLLKRAFDIIVATVGLLVISPLLTLIALIIKLSDGGPIFYKQERMGLNGRRFMMLKFRSMRVDAEDKTGPVWASTADDRRTKFGTFLRETSLDELPQLFNVIKGDMSLVGPRPERPFFIQKFRQSIPRYMLRHQMKAGITGWAQVNGWRGNTSLRKRVQYDLYYITNWSLWLDFRIMVQTVLKAMWDKNAY